MAFVCSIQYLRNHEPTDVNEKRELNETMLFDINV